MDNVQLILLKEHPTKDSTQKVKAKVKVTMKDSRFTLEQRIAKCGSIVRGWRNYHRSTRSADLNIKGSSLD